MYLTKQLVFRIKELIIQKHSDKSKKSESKDLHCASVYMAFWNKQAIGLENRPALRMGPASKGKHEGGALTGVTSSF
jgi:hypothetical protein